MKKQPKKLTLNKETLRDLTAKNAGEVKGGDKSKNCGTHRTWVHCHTAFGCY